MIISSCAHRCDGKRVNGLKICSEVVAIFTPFSLSPSTHPSREFCSLQFTHGANFFYFFKILFTFVSRRPQVDLSVLLSLLFFKRNLRSNDSLNMFSPRLTAVVFVALLGIVNVAGLPLWREVRPFSLYLFGCVESITVLMALSACLISAGSGAVRTYSSLCEAR